MERKIISLALAFLMVFGMLGAFANATPAMVLSVEKTVFAPGETLVATVTGVGSGEGLGATIGVVLCRPDDKYYDSLGEYARLEERAYQRSKIMDPAKFEFAAPMAEGEWELRFFSDAAATPPVFHSKVKITVGTEQKDPIKDIVFDMDKKEIKPGEKFTVAVSGKDAGQIVAVVLCRVGDPYLDRIDDYLKQPDKYHCIPNDKGTGRFEFTAPEGDGEWELRYFVLGAKGELICHLVEAIKLVGGKSPLPAMPTPTAEIDYVEEKLTGLLIESEGSSQGPHGTRYTFNGLEEGLFEPYRQIDENWYGTTVSIVIKGDGVTKRDSAAQNISIPNRPAKPVPGKTDCTNSQNNNGTITGVTPAMEYRKDPTSLTWTAITGTTVTALAPGNYSVRVKAVAGTSFASAIATVTIKPVAMPTPTASIDYTTEYLIGLVSGGQYSFNGGAAETLSGTSKAIAESWFGTQVSIVRKGDGTTSVDSEAQYINIKSRPAVPSVGKTDCTTSQNNNGTLTGVSSAMEYQKSGDTAWKSITGTTVTGLANGTYYVRLKAVAGTSFRSKNATVTIAPYASLFAPRERYHFPNSGSNFKSKYNVSDSDFNKLANYVIAEYGTSISGLVYAANIINGLQNSRNSSWEGSCFGMAATSILDKKGQINMKNMVSPAVADLWSVPKPVNTAKVESAINYYQISQGIPFINERFDVPYDSSLTLAQKLEGLVNNAKNKKIMQLGFRIPDWGGHAIVIFGYEAGTGGTHRLLAYDVNYPNSDTIVTVSADYKTCHVEPYRGAGKVSNIRYTANFGFYNKIKIAGILDSDMNSGKKFTSTADVENIAGDAGDMAMNTQLSINAKEATTVTNAKGQTLVYNPSTGEFSGTMPTLAFNYVEGAMEDGGSGSSTIIIAVPDSDGFAFETDGQGLDVSVVGPGIYAATSSDKANKVTVANGEGVTVGGSGAIDFKMSLGLNSDLCDMVSLTGRADGEASLRYDGSGGAVAKGDFTKETTLTIFSNIVNINEIKFTSKSREVQVTKESGKFGVKDVTGQGKPELKNPFTDVSEKDWFYKDVMYAYGMGLINGKSATLFAPADNLTYAEVVKLAACMHQLYTTGKVTLTVGSGAWYQSYVDYAKANKIISKDYEWTKAATRAGYMEIFANALPDDALAPANSVADGAIPDVPANHPQAAAIYKLYRAGIVQGVDAAKNCKPDSNIRRSDVAAILTRMMDKGARVEFSLK